MRGHLTSLHRKDGELGDHSYAAELFDGPDESGQCTFRVTHEPGDPDMPQGGTMLVMAPLSAFTPD